MRRTFVLGLLLLAQFCTSAQAETGRCEDTRYFLGVGKFAPIHETTDELVYRTLRPIVQQARFRMPIVCEFRVPNVRNVFILWRDPQKEPSLLIFSRDIVDHLTERQLKGVFAHEVAHLVRKSRGLDVVLWDSRDRFLEEMKVDALAAKWVGKDVVLDTLRALLAITKDERSVVSNATLMQRIIHLEKTSR